MMNHQYIREIAKQAGLVSIDRKSKYFQDSMEKFAELIVAEILQTCENHPVWTGRMIGEQIKEHFGVEE